MMPAGEGVTEELLLGPGAQGWVIYKDEWEQRVL